jgi:hypothetical protein
MRVTRKKSIPERSQKVDVQNETENMHGNEAKSANYDEPRVDVESEVKRESGNEVKRV